MNIDRPGADYRNFDLPAPSPEMCRNQCMSDPACVAFTYVNPGVQAPVARCWLKSQVPPPVPNGCCISGVRFGAPPGPQAFERGINRRGMDYRNFDLATPNPELCWNECLREPRCRAYTYVHPGVQGPMARCWLKDGVPNPTQETCCVSGVK
jgi:hypothetical protein